MQDNAGWRSRVEDRLRSLPDRMPPADLHWRIMEELPESRSVSERNSVESVAGSGGKRLRRILEEMAAWFNRWPQPLLAGIAAVCLLVTFYSGMQFNRLYRPSPSVSLPGSIPIAMDRLNADASFFLGRSLLAAGKPAMALSSFQRAEILRPENPEYSLWKAAAYYALGDRLGEKESYLRIIERRPDFLPARLNLAHNFFQDGRLDQAEALYEQVLAHDPLEKSALYNRALILHLQQKKKAEQKAWRTYLARYRTGAQSFRAVRHLHDLGDYGYRQYQLGYRKIILCQDHLLAGPGREREAELRYLTDQFSRQPESVLNLVVFAGGDAEGARKTALALRAEIIRGLPKEKRKTIRVSWFGEPEPVGTGGEDVRSLTKGILIFSNPENSRKGEQV